jgi:hypothetical protein
VLELSAKPLANQVAGGPSIGNKPIPRCLALISQIMARDLKYVHGDPLSPCCKAIAMYGFKTRTLRRVAVAAFLSTYLDLLRANVGKGDAGHKSYWRHRVPRWWKTAPESMNRASVSYENGNSKRGAPFKPGAFGITRSPLVLGTGPVTSGPRREPPRCSEMSKASSKPLSASEDQVRIVRD